MAMIHGVMLHGPASQALERTAAGQRSMLFRETTRTLPSIHAAIRRGRGRLRLEFCEASISRVAHGSGARWWCRACRWACTGSTWKRVQPRQGRPRHSARPHFGCSCLVCIPGHRTRVAGSAGQAAPPRRRVWCVF